MRWTSLPFIVAVACNPTRAPQPTTPPPPASEPAPIDVDAIVAQSRLPDTLDTPLPDDPLQVTIHRLSNGLTVYLSPMPEAGRVSATVVVRVGAADDPADAPGLTHLLEHMLEHQGTDELGTIDREAERPHLDALPELYRLMRRGDADREGVFAQIREHAQAVAQTSIPDEITHLYRSLGFVRTRVDTNHDRLQLTTELPRDRLRQWAELEAERFADPVFRLLYAERSVVLDELDRQRDAGWQRSRDASLAAAYPSHPLSKPMLGTREHLRAPDYDALVRHFERWVVPNNMALVLVGDVDASVLTTLEAAFSRLEPAHLPRRASTSTKPGHGRRGIEIRAATGGERVELTWRTVPAVHPDAPALRLLDELLGSPAEGVLATKLAIPGLVNDPSASLSHFRDGGVLRVAGQLPSEMYHSGIEQRLLDTIAAFPAELTEADIRAAKLGLRISTARRREWLAQRASEIVQSFAWEQQWQDAMSEPARIQALTLADVRRVARAHLGEDYVAVWGFALADNPPPLEEAPDVGPLHYADAVESTRGRAVRAAAPRLTRPDFADIGHGLTELEAAWGSLVATRNDTDDLFELRLRIDRGYRSEPLVCHAVDVWARSGAAGRSPADIRDALHRMGSTVWTHCNAQETMVVIDGIDEHFDETLALVAMWLAEAKIEDAVWSEFIGVERRRRAYRVDNLDSVSQALRFWARFGGDSIRLIEPSTTALREAPTDSLEALLSGLGEFRRTVTYYGPRSPERVAEATGAFGPGTREPESAPFSNHRRRRVPEIHVAHVPGATAKIEITYLAPRQQPDTPTVEWIARRVVRRRGSKAVRSEGVGEWAGTTVTTGDPQNDARLWGTIRVQPERAAAAVPVALNALASTEVDRAVVAQELNSLRGQLRTSQPTAREVLREFVEWRDDGYSRNVDALAWEGLDGLDAADVTALLEHLTQYAPIITIVGDLYRVDLEALEAIGPVRHHKRASLFSFEPPR